MTPPKTPWGHKRLDCKGKGTTPLQFINMKTGKLSDEKLVVCKGYDYKLKKITPFSRD